MLKKHKLNPLKNEGWSFEFEFLLKLAQIAEEQHGERVQLEGVNAVLLALLRVKEQATV